MAEGPSDERVPIRPLPSNSSATSNDAACATSSACAGTPTSPCSRRWPAARIDFVNVRHEQVAAHAADGYARVTGRASVVLSHLSPGLTNAATGVANAALDCIPMVVIAGDVPSHYFGRHPHQEVNLHADGAQFEIYRPFVKRAWRVDKRRVVPRDHRQGVPARRERPARPGARRRADGRLLAIRRPGTVRPPRPRHQDVAPALPRRRDGGGDRHPPRRGSAPGDLRRWRSAARAGERRTAPASSSTSASRSPTA